MSLEISAPAVLELVVFGHSSCDVCKILISCIQRVGCGEKYKLISIKVVLVDQAEVVYHPLFERLRIYPTIIAFFQGIAMLGWEGFAAMAPEEIRDTQVVEVLDQIVALLSIESVESSSAATT